jgi:hypothetical protein
MAHDIIKDMMEFMDNFFLLLLLSLLPVGFSSIVLDGK